VQASLALDDVRALETHTADVVVIGAGIAGLSAAACLGTAGKRPLVLEAAPSIGMGATGRNAGILSAGINMALADLPPDSLHRQMWRATTRELLDLVDAARHTGALLSASRTGALSLAQTPSAARHLAREAQARIDTGLSAELWDASQVARATHDRLNTRSMLAALWLPDEGRVQPLTLLAHAARQARQSGAVLAGSAPVLAYEEHDLGSGPRWRLRLEHGIHITARALIVATGPTARPTSRIFALAFSAGLPDDFPLFWDASPYTYCDYRPGDGRLLTSGGRYGRVGGSPRDANYHRRLAEAARRWLPELADRQPTHAWAVDLAVAADMVPAVRTLGERAAGCVIEGLGALGVLPGIVLGRQAADIIAGQL
jgi:sarcosine oxidase subunit beta